MEPNLIEQKQVPENSPKPWFTNELFNLVLGIISAVTGVFGVFATALESSLGISILCISLFFIIQWITLRNIKKIKTVSGGLKAAARMNGVAAAKTIRILSFAFWIFPVYTAIRSFNEHNRCRENNQLGIVISNFSATADDDFSYKLTSTLSSDLEHVDSISIVRDARFIQFGAKDHKKQLTDGLADNCFNSGILVFGKHSLESKVFDCNIYLSNLHALGSKNVITGPTGIIYLQNPDIINFSVDKEAQLVSSFIYSLLDYSAGNYEKSSERLRGIITEHSNVSRKFDSYCKLFLGNSLLRSARPIEAAEVYQSAIVADSLNPFVHYNLGSCFLALQDSLNAQRAFSNASRLNPKLDQPLAGFIATTKAPNYSEDTPEGEVNKTSRSRHFQGLEEDEDGFSGEFTILVRQQKHGIINRKGDTIVPLKYDYINPYPFMHRNRKFFIIQFDNLFGALHIDGSEAIPVNYPKEDEVLQLLQSR